MQDISSIFFSGIVGAGDVLIAGVRGLVRSVVLRQAQYERPFYFGLGNMLGRLSKALSQSRTASLASRHEVAIMYFGRTSEFLMMTSERMVIPAGRYTLGQLLCSLYKRGERWAYELDDSHLMCTIDGANASLFDTIAPGAEVCISSRKSIFEA